MSLLPFFSFPLIIIALGEIPFSFILSRVLIIEPFIFFLGILNPVFEPVRGWLSLSSILLKTTLTVSSALLLVSTTGIHRIGYALRLLFVPKLFVFQLLLIYKYMMVLISDVGKTILACKLRSLDIKGIPVSTWGPLLGNLILRTYKRAERIYYAMILKGFEGEYHTGTNLKFSYLDLIYVLFWSCFFISFRFFNISSILGRFVIGVFS